MAYKSMSECASDLEKNGHLLRIKTPISPDLDMAELHFRSYESQGPALLFENIIGSPFQAISNVYGSNERIDFLFRKTLSHVKNIIEIKANPDQILKSPLSYLTTPWHALKALPLRTKFASPILYGETSIEKLPQIKSWPNDGGGFVTLPQVFTLPPGEKNLMKSNIGMYRIQLSGNDYMLNKEIGLHYQLHRGIGVHHTAYHNSEEEMKISIFIGGPPSHAFGAIMPLPEGLSELTFMGLLGGRRFRYIWREGFLLSSDADFVITGTLAKNKLKPEGPFGDHLGYYSLKHMFPYMKVHKVYHRKNPMWHFTAVGRPPQEDSSFGYLIHKLVEPLTTSEFPGIVDIHAVDSAGVHPLLLAVGSERYMPFREPRPEEILSQANHLLGKGQTSLAKFLIIAAANDAPKIRAHQIEDFFYHTLERIDWRRDLHFQTKTTIDTLDYSGSGWNAGSKVIMACYGPILRKLAKELPLGLSLSSNWDSVKVVMPGVLAISGSEWNESYKDQQISQLIIELKGYDLSEFPLIVIVDDADFVSQHINNFLWVAFTRANPAVDITGIDSFTEDKHWGCSGSLIIDSRIKPHHAPPLIRDKSSQNRIDQLFRKGGELYNAW